MRKLIASFIILGLGVTTLGPVVGIANDNTVQTELERDSGGGSPPVVKAKWEMKGPCFDGRTWNNCAAVHPQDGRREGLDDSTAAGAQFAAPGTWGAKMNYTVCAIVTDPNGAADIYGVYADIYYPSNRKMHKLLDRDPYTPDPNEDIDNPTGGCGDFIEQNTLIKLSKEDGYDLFCNWIRQYNYNLPTYNVTDMGYTSLEDMYNDICGPDGELMKEEAFVYCDDKFLLWEEPAGDYRVVVTALDKGGKSSNPLENHFTYLETVGFEKDFTQVDYGEVLLSTDKKIAGDKEFGTPDRPTIRNTGNTRLYMKVAQDDMGLGKSSDQWNVKYDARVGSDANWTYYYPFKFKDGDDTNPGTPPTSYYTISQEILDLSETEEMDFSIHVYKWPDTNTNYSGWMWLAAGKAGWIGCSTTGG